ncbi:MAG: metallophosphoesterase family protein [Gammaproteobacteria bacterium]
MPIVGVISDTHGLLREEAISELNDSDFIIHAGDIGKEQVIKRLSEIAPVIAVRGNIDKDDWAAKYPEYETAQVDDVSFYVLHRIEDLDLDPVAAGFQVVVTGHSHKPDIQKKEGVIYLNPGSAGPRRFTLPICLAKVDVEGKSAKAKLIHLDA